MRSIVFAASLIILLGSAELSRTATAQPSIAQTITPQQEALQQFEVGEKQFQANQFESARAAYKNALNIWVKLDRKSFQGSLYLKLAQVDEVLGEYDRAMEHYQQALTIFKELDRPIERSGSLSGIGIIFVRTGKYSQAIESFQHALKIFPESSGALN